MKKYIIIYIFNFFYFKKLFAIDTKAEQAVVIDFDTNEILLKKILVLKHLQLL